jgi:hypothetical protein
MKNPDQELEFTASNRTEKNKHPNDYFTATFTPPREYTGENFEADYISYTNSATAVKSFITGRYDEGVPGSYVGLQIVFQKDLPDGTHEVGPVGSAVTGSLAFSSLASSRTEIVRAKKGKLHIERHSTHNSITATVEMEFEYQNETIKVSNGKVHATSDTPI